VHAIFRGRIVRVKVRSMSSLSIGEVARKSGRAASAIRYDAWLEHASRCTCTPLADCALFA